MTDLSPAARAIWEAFNSKFDWVEDGVPGPQFHSIAAALRAAADQVVPEEPHPEESQFWDDEANREWQNNRYFREQLLAIADELDPPSS